MPRWLAQRPDDLFGILIFHSTAPTVLKATKQPGLTMVSPGCLCKIPLITRPSHDQAAIPYSKHLFRFSSESSAKYKPYKRPAIKHLIAYCHWEVHSPCLHPCAKSFCILEQQCSCKAHNWAHNAANANRDRICDKLRSITRFNNRESEFLRDLSHKKEFQNKSNRHHDRQFIKCCKKGFPCYAACVERNIVNDHSIHHNGGHNKREYDIFQFVFRQNKILLMITDNTCVVRYHPGGLCVSN